MKPIYLLSLLVLFAACKKEQKEPSKPVTYAAPDFALIPVKDAKWYVHVIYEHHDFRGYDPADINIEAVKDQLINAYYVLSATNKDTFYEGYSYHLYSGTVSIVEPYDSKPAVQPYLTWLREDTVAQKVYEAGGRLVIDFSDDVNKGQVVPFPTWPKMEISEPGGLILNNQKFKSWSMRNVYDERLEYFYKAIGIGSRSGILGFEADYFVNQVVSLDFVYNGDSIHFDYPLQ